MQFFKSPLSKDYWRESSAQVKNLRMLVVAALMVALRVALKSIYIPVGDNLNIMAGFFINALGSMIYGPVLAALTGVASDLLGVMLFPKGPYFFPFTIIEMMGSVIYALYLYRAKLSPARIFLSKLTINVFINIICNSIALSWLYGRAVGIYLIPRVAKNLLIFPLEAILLTLFLSAMAPVVRRLGMDIGEQPKLVINRSHIVILAALFIVSVAAVAAYYAWFL